MTVHFELRSQPWLVFAELRREGGRTVERNRSSLDLLLQERAPEKAPVRASADDNEEIRRMIFEKARQLRDYGRDVLQGDFQVFPRLKELAAENLRRRNAAEA